ncbi:glycosyl transferase family 1 [Bacillus sp. AFS073361]|uniref:glycosyltransferase family 1 protein n=1 Tax=Bacillus sp. AFS073361 TaxID=2033511 RepID=UPI000BF3C523|nr:glycosyltransferase family 1 protein [Bacillus sp. AFS073361]PFP29490.1 glycosyl transferase family 1 [Bacillus sp. AFS073361]
MGNPLRILHVVVNMNRGGAETLLMNLYRNIDRSIIQFDFLTCKEGIFDKEINQMGGKVHRIPYISDVGHFQYIKQLDTFFANHQEYKIVHSHMDKMSGLVLRAAKRAGIPNRISHSHSTSNEGSIIAKFYKWYAGKHILPNATKLLACSNQAAKWLFKNKSEKALILKNGIECERFKFSPKIRGEIRAELKVNDESLIIGHVGRFSTPKNHLFLIEIYKEVIKVHPNSKLILVGDGPLLLEIKSKVSEYNLTEKVEFLGVRSDVDHLLQAFDLFIFPSFYEGLPVTVIEAQGAGLPCLISDSITQEVDMGLNLVEFFPISNKDVWIERIKKIEPDKVQRFLSVPVLSKKGYDIKDTSKQLQDFYSVVSR